MFVIDLVFFILLLPYISVSADVCPSDVTGPTCTYEVFFYNATCANVRAELNKRIAGKNGWEDPQVGTYTMLNQAGNDIRIKRVSSSGQEFDIVIWLYQDWENCRGEVCSASVDELVNDDTRQYCNIHDIYCAEEGCNPFEVLQYDESNFSCKNEESDVTQKCNAGTSSLVNATY